MKKLLTLFLFFTIASVFPQKQAYGDGEWFKFRVHYGFVTAGYATLEVENGYLDGRSVYHVKGEGNENGVVGATVELGGGSTLLGSYHPSQQNTFTGRLTRRMFHTVFRRARKLIDSASETE